MKILTISDVVDNLVQSPALRDRFSDVDLVLSCGDLPYDYLEYIVTVLCRPLYYVFGNHAQTLLKEDGQIQTAPEGCIDMHRRVTRHKGLLLAGLEGSIRYREGDHQYTQGEMRLMVNSLAPRLWFNRIRHGRALDILITHSPPFGIHDGRDLPHQGFLALLDMMDRFKPRYLIHGHTHLYRSDARRVTQYRQTTVINTYGHQIIEIDDETLR